LNDVDLLDANNPQSPSMLPQQHRHLGKLFNIISRQEAMALQAPSSHIPSQTSPTTSGVEQWNMEDEFHASKARTFHASCHVYYQHPWGRWPSPYFGANSNASVLTFSHHFDDAREFIEFKLVHPCSEKPVNKWIKVN
jgi:hypothetical protein